MKEELGKKEINGLELQLQKTVDENSQLQSGLKEVQEKASKPSVYLILLVIAAVIISSLLGRL